MNRQQQRRLKRHPLIRFLRAIIRLGRVFFGRAKPPRQNSVLTREQLPEDSNSHSMMEEAPKPSLNDPDLTVGEIFGLVQWRLPEPVQQPAPMAISQKKAAVAAPEHGGILNVSKVQSGEPFITVSQLFELVQWQLSDPSPPTALSLAAGAAQPQHSDFSMN